MLRFWLPYNKDERMVGLSPTTATSYSNASIIDGSPTGGKCASGVKIFHTATEEFGNSWTIATWVNSAGWSQYNDIISCKNADASDYCQWYFSIINGATFNLGINGGSGTVSVGYTFATNTWYHVAATYDGDNGGHYAMYVNGVCVKSGTYASVMRTGCTNVGVVTRSGNAAGTSPVGGTSKTSDFRIYDHALKDWEIRKLYNSKSFEVFGGLYLEETTNLITGITRGGQTTVTDGEVVTTGTNADTYFTLNLSESIVVGTQYTISCYADMPSGTYWDFPIGGQTNTSLMWRIVPGYNSYTFTANDFNYGAGRLFMDDMSGSARQSGQSCKFYRFQLEKRGSATPLSFGHRDNRIVDISETNHNITPSNVAKSGSTFYFNGNDAAINIPIAGTITGGTWSINIWFYRPNGEWGTKTWETLIGGPSGFELSSKNGGTNTPQIRTYSWTNSGYTYECDKWNMVTLTRTPSGSKCYINGVLKHNGTAGAVPNNNYFLGAWNTATQQNFRGYIRSASVYKRELTQEDITNLYIHNE